MQFIKHRVNSIAELGDLRREWGVEIDLRSDINSPGALHLSHDPWVRGDDFTAWAKAFAEYRVSGPIILNVKEDGLEAQVLAVLERYSLHNFFFLDTALPTLVHWTMRKRDDRFAVRLSAYEPYEFCRRFAGKARWLWVDCFGAVPVAADLLARLKRDFSICLVSPELQQGRQDQVQDFAEIYALADAVCTKFPEAWPGGSRP